VLQRVAVAVAMCFNMLVSQCIAVCCSVLQRPNWRRILKYSSSASSDSIVLQCVALCGSVLQRVAACCSVLQCVAVCCSVLQCVAVCFSVLQCVAVFCSVLQCVTKANLASNSEVWGCYM